VGHFRQWSRLGGNLPGNSIPDGLPRKQSKSVEPQKDFPETIAITGKLCEKVTVFAGSFGYNTNTNKDKHINETKEGLQI
jgi:hypothetical protein